MALVRLPRVGTKEAALRPWLQASGSLTRQLTLAAGGRFAVEPVREGFARCSIEDSRRLGVRAGSRVWRREVLLYGADAVPWVAACTLVPQGFLSGRGRRLRHLGRRSLGQQLFARGRRPAATRWIDHSTLGWRRTTRYGLPGGAVLVSEVFLADFLVHLGGR